MILLQIYRKGNVYFFVTNHKMVAIQHNDQEINYEYKNVYSRLS